MTRALRVCGRVGTGGDARTHRMSELLGDVQPLIAGDAGLAFGSAACRTRHDDARAVGGQHIAYWSAAPLPQDRGSPARELAQDLDADSLTLDDGVACLRTGISGARPLYAEIAGDSTHFSSSLDALARSRDSALRPDWNAWAHIIAAGGPINGRTTFAGIRRLGPWSRLSTDADGTPRLESDEWPWLSIESTPGTTTAPLRDALESQVGQLAAFGPIASLLSGGWDSRILAVFARRATDRLSAWTTSSDTGHVLEQLVAAKVAHQLRIDHTIASPRWDEFGADLTLFARAVDYQTSFHVWAAPLARQLAGSEGTVVDGLGGGIFVGGAFPDTGVPRRERLTNYLQSSAAVLHPSVTHQVRERTWADFAAAVSPFEAHPYSAMFTAYVTRTLPGIALSPQGLFASAAPVATPFLTDSVVRAALAIPPDEHADGRLYPELIAAVDAELAELPTAADLAPAHREHPRRVSSAEAAAVIRDLITRGPARELLAPGLAEADLAGWQTLLDRTKSQHLLRGLAVLALWLDAYADVLIDADPAALREPVG